MPATAPPVTLIPILEIDLNVSSATRFGGIVGIVPMLLFVAGPISAQLVPGVPIAVELRPNVTLPAGGVSDTGPGLGAETGYGIAATVRARVRSGLGVYAGYQYGRLGCGACGGVGLQEDLGEEGFEAGVRWTPPFLTVAGYEPWLGAGALIGRKLQISGQQGDLVSDGALGWGLGAGVLLPLGGSFAVTPGLHVRGYSAQFTVPDLGFALFGEPGTFAREVDVIDISLEVGLSYEF